MEADCKAPKPPARSNAMATNPSVKAQKILCQTGLSSFPPDAIVSITREAESDEVTKKTAISITATIEVNPEKGKCSKNLKSAVETSFETAVGNTVNPS